MDVVVVVVVDAGVVDLEVLAGAGAGVGQLGRRHGHRAGRQSVASAEMVKAL